MRKIRVLVVDDHTVVRQGICSLLNLAPDIEVVGEAANGEKSIELVRKLRPDVVLMDVAMPVMGGLEATRRITRSFPHTKILVLTQYDDREYVFPIIEGGASGFISKTAASSDLLSGIRSVYAGHSFLSPSVTRFLVESHRQAAATVTSSDPYQQLTDRERETLKLLAEGHTIQETANMLGISGKTVDGYKTSLMAKLDIHNRTDLVKYALRKGIITI